VTWGSVDSQVVLADCLYCRSRRAAFGPLPPLTKAREGLAHRRSERRGSAGEGAPVTGSRWRKPRAREQRSRFVAGKASALQAIVSSSSLPREAWALPCASVERSASAGTSLRKRVRRCESSAVGCRALVDGRRPGPVKRLSFDEAAAEAGRAAHGDGESAMSNHGWLHTGSLERTSEAMSHARSAAENARIGRPGAEEQRSKLHQDCAGSDDQGSLGSNPEARGQRCGRGRSWRIAVKRSSTRWLVR
jgi:hypothetical protein